MVRNIHLRDVGNTSLDADIDWSEYERISESDRELSEWALKKVRRGVKKAIVKCKRYDVGRTILIDLLLYSGLSRRHKFSRGR